MSTPTQSQFSLNTYLPQTTAFDPRLPDSRPSRNYVHSSNFPMLTPTTLEISHFHQPSVTELPLPERTPFPWHANQVYTALSTSPRVNRQTQHNSTLREYMQMVPEPLSTSSPPTVVRTYGNDSIMASASHSAYDPRPCGSYLDSHAGFDPSCSLRSNSSDRYLLPHPIEQDIRNSGDRPPDEPNAYRSPSHATYSHYPSVLNDQNVADSFTPHHLPLSSQFLPHWSPRPTSIGYLEPDPRFRLVPPEDSASSSRRRRGARAIEYGGLWIDEEELLKGLVEPSAKLSVLQCLWEEDRSPCHLWIKSDKSCIHAHIQKWHGGRPGGDKLEVDCHWSACGQKMLKESIARHILSIHLGEMWECQGCGKGNARKDAYGRHVVRSDFEGCRTAGALITHSADVRVIDARAALDSGGRLRYADT